MTAASRRPHRWFAVAQYNRWVVDRGGAERLPTSMVHAKEMGTTTTACGLSCESWMKWWEYAFPMRGTTPCPNCQAGVAN